MGLVMRVLQSKWCQMSAVAVMCTSCAAPEEIPQVDSTEESVPVARAVAAVATVAFTEGPTVHEDGTVYFTDLRGEGGRILRMRTDGVVDTFREPSFRANGLVFDSDWRLLACESGNGEDVLPRVTRTNLETDEIEVLADEYEGKQFHAPNDLTFDGKGRIYFTDRPGPNPTPEQSGLHGVYRIDPDGTVVRILVEPEIERPNGIVISPGDDTLYLIETAQQAGGARMIRAYDLADDGTVSNMRVFHDFYPGRSGDGMTIDSEGNLYVAAGLNRLRGTSETLDTVAGVHVFSPDGVLLEHIAIPEDTITNAAFGGDDLRTLYVTAGKTLFEIRTDVTGTRR